MATEPTEIVSSACVGPSGSAIGMPQLCADWMPNQVFWLLVTLFVIYFVMSRIALPRIGAVLAERSGTITNDLAAAEDLKEKAREAEAAYDKALADARIAASKIVADARAAIQADLDKELARADEQIKAQTAESEKAIADIRASASESIKEVARDVTEALVAAMGGSADAGTVDAAVAAQMKG